MQPDFLVCKTRIGSIAFSDTAASPAPANSSFQYSHKSRFRLCKVSPDAFSELSKKASPPLHAATESRQPGIRSSNEHAASRKPIFSARPLQSTSASDAANTIISVGQNRRFARRDNLENILNYNPSHSIGDCQKSRAVIM